MVKPSVIPRSFVAAAVLVLLSIVGAGTVAPSREPTTHTVVIEGSHFEPEVLAVRAGDKVTWVNKDPFPHTATSADNFDSTAIQPEQSWTFTTKTQGEFAYLCSFHPTTMKATLRVE